MKVTYMQHSAFSIETDSYTLLFDDASGHLHTFRKDIPLYIFVSHHHEDHFHKGIFDYLKQYTHVTYILSDDISLRRKDHCVFVEANNSYLLDSLQITTLQSTDEGVAFLLNDGQYHFYFAGDLNWWDWGSEDSVEEAKLMKEAYLNEMKKLQDEHFDIAFVPIDPRLSQGYWKGLYGFLQYTQADYIFPMHFWGAYTIQDNLKQQKELDLGTAQMIKIHKEHESFILDI